MKMIIILYHVDLLKSKKKTEGSGMKKIIVKEG